MKGCTRLVSKVLIGLDRVGLVGLEAAFERADASGLEDPEELVALLMEALDTDNYVPETSEEDYRGALWREYLRHRGEDIRDLYSQIDVLLRARPGEERDRITHAVTTVLAEHELQPSFSFATADPSAGGPQVSIAGQSVVEGAWSEGSLRRAVRAQLHDW